MPEHAAEVMPAPGRWLGAREYPCEQSPVPFAVRFRFFGWALCWVSFFWLSFGLGFIFLVGFWVGFHFLGWVLGWVSFFCLGFVLGFFFSILKS